jgi:hypothetical protein
MSLRSFARWAASIAFILLVAPVVGDFVSEFARENGVYDNATGRIWRVVEFAQSIFGQNGFYWLLFFTGGLAAGFWIDFLLRRSPPERETPDPVAMMAARLGLLFGMPDRP